jgi:hypothetical protein
LVSFGCLNSLSEPAVRAAARLVPGEALTFAMYPTPLVSFGWLQGLSEPQVKMRPGLLPSAQQFFAYYPRLTPGGSITATMNVIEIKDVFFGSGVRFNVPTQVKVGFIEARFQNVAGLIETSS